MVLRRRLCLGLISFVLLFLALVPAVSAGDNITSEQAFMQIQQERPWYAVVPDWLWRDPAALSRQDFLNELWRWTDQGWTRDHINYGTLGTIVTVTNDPRDTAFVEYGSYHWTQPLGDIFVGGVVLHVLKTDDQHFIMSSCGNHTQWAGTPQIPSISGYKFEDYDRDGRRDSGEPGLAGWQINLYRQGQYVRSTTTDSTGRYVFSMAGLDPGTFTMTENCPSPWVRTLTPGPVVIPYGPGGVYGGNDFGNFYPSSISGSKFDDLNEDGIWQTGEPAVASWPIRLYRDGALVATTQTDAQGRYSFSGLAPATYTLSEDLPAPWRVTCAPEAVQVLAAHGHDYGGNNFGNFYPGVIRGAKWDDSDADGAWDQGAEVGLAGWTILLVEGGQVADSVVTGSDGSYEFSGLGCGSYEVWEQLEDGSSWRQTFPVDNEGVPPAGTSAAGHYADIAIQGHALVTGKDFGNVETGSIVKVVEHFWWHEGIPGARVTLAEVTVPGVLSNDPALPREAMTDAGGSCRFDRLLPGVYRLSVELPVGLYPHLPTSSAELVDVREGETTDVLNEVHGGAQAEPRTLGFWKNWRNKYSQAQILDFIERVKTGSQNFSNLDIPLLDSILNTSGKKSTLFVMAQAQYLVLWLNLSSEKLGFTTVVDLTTIADWHLVVTDDDGVLDLNALMLELRSRYNAGGLTERQWEAFKDICDALNNSLLFP